jgi:hypothetical protein
MLITQDMLQPSTRNQSDDYLRPLSHAISGHRSTFPTCARGYAFSAPIRGGDVSTHVESICYYKKESLAAGGLTRVAEGSAVVTTPHLPAPPAQRKRPYVELLACV